MHSIEKTSAGWIITGGDLAMTVDGATGTLTRLEITAGKPFTWSAYPGDVTVRDDRARFEFDRSDLADVGFTQKGDALLIRKHFKGAPWRLDETYRVEDEAVAWNAEITLDHGDFRSCAVSFCVPWPQPVHSIKFWSARNDMPSAPQRFAEIALEYGEVTSGILIPALCAYLERQDTGLLMAMPFDFRTPRFRFISDFRGPNLKAQFDWLALPPGQPARVSLLFRGTRGAWRPALGWLYERYKEYFEPRSALIHSLWGGHVCGGFDVTPEQARAMADLGLKWHEIHCHFPMYGNYHPEGMSQWPSEPSGNQSFPVTVDLIRRTIRNLHAVGAAAMPYIQVTGDGDPRLPFDNSRLLDLHGNRFTAWAGTNLMNSDPSLPFGRDMTRQINGMVERYPEMDGVFVDQLCYNILDTAHDDGITALNNRPAYMTGFNYFPHLERLSSLLHPNKAIIGNGPFGIGIMKYVDAVMAEGSGWLCDQFQYYALAKPMFFLMYKTDDRDVEAMFQSCLIHGAGYTSYANAAASKDLYDKYVPLLEKLFRRRWVFDPNPLQLPTGFSGNVFRRSPGAWVASVVSVEPRLPGRGTRDNSVCVRTTGIDSVERVILSLPGETERQVPFRREPGALLFDVPDNVLAAVAELHGRA